MQVDFLKNFEIIKSIKQFKGSERILFFSTKIVENEAHIESLPD